MFLVRLYHLVNHVASECVVQRFSFMSTANYEAQFGLAIRMNSV